MVIYTTFGLLMQELMKFEGNHTWFIRVLNDWVKLHNQFTTGMTVQEKNDLIDDPGNLIRLSNYSNIVV